MATVNVHDAKTNFSRLLKRVEQGERITIARAGKPVAELTPIAQSPVPRRPIGIDRGKVLIHDDWDDPIPGFEEYF
jgi:prevent-host-death family protein